MSRTPVTFETDAAARVDAGPILSVRDLQVQFKTDDGIVRAVNGLSFDVAAGKTLGIVGESGCGKSVTNLAIMGLIPQPPGKVVGGEAIYRGRDLLKLPPRELCKIRGNRVAMIFQDPMTSLNPLMTVEKQLTEVTRLHLGHSQAEARRHAIDMLEKVGIPGAERRIDNYPHEFSGGMRQRVMVAMALACDPDVLIADEPTTALDVTIQAQILDLMRELQNERGTAIILVTHDMGVVANICDDVMVMYAGRAVECADIDTLFANPRHPYTLGLLHSISRLDAPLDQKLEPIEGQPPDLAHLPLGCPFEPRCSFHIDRCRQEDPPLETSRSGGLAACWVNVDEAKPPEATDV